MAEVRLDGKDRDGAAAALDGDDRVAGVEPNHPASREFAPLFHLDLIVKDLRTGALAPVKIPRVSSVAWAGDNATLFYVYNIYRTAFQYFELGYGASQSVILFLLIAVLTLVMFRVSRLWVHYAGE